MGFLEGAVLKRGESLLKDVAIEKCQHHYNNVYGQEPFLAYSEGIVLAAEALSSSWCERARLAKADDVTETQNGTQAVSASFRKNTTSKL